MKRIFFYGIEKFNANFQNMLKAIGYEGNADFESMRLETFNRYCFAVEGDKMKYGIFELYNGTTKKFLYLEISLIEPERAACNKAALINDGSQN